MNNYIFFIDYNNMSYYVSPTGSDSNDGLSTSTPFATLSKAITTASNGNTIYVMDGTHNYSTTVSINKEVTIRSLNGKSAAILNKTTGGDFLSVVSNNVTITDLTIQANATNTADSLINISRSSSGVDLPTKYTNINITNNNLKLYKYGVTINGGNITITGNTITRNGGTERLSLFLVYYIRDTITISNNTHVDTLRTQRFVYLTAAGTAGSAYLDRVNSKGGTMIINNNTIDTSANTTQKPIMFIQDYFNTYTYGAVGSDSNYNSNTKLDITMDGNTMLGNSTALCDFFVPYLVSSTSLNNYSKVTIKNNTVSHSNAGMLKVDAAASVTIDSAIIDLVYLFYVFTNTITNFTLSASRTGDASISQTTSTILPANLYTLENTKFITIAAPKSDQTITFNALSDQVYSLDGEITMNAIASSGLPVSYSSSNTSVVIISGNKLIIKGVGTSTITASQGGDSSYNAAVSQTQTQTIIKADQTITFNELVDQVYVLNKEITLTATSSSGLDVSYSSSNESVAVISGDKLIIKGVGSAVITASQGGDSNYNAASNIEQTQTVNPALGGGTPKQNQTITFDPLPDQEYSLDSEITLTAIASSGLTVSYSSSNTSVVIISGDKLIIKGVGTSTITASQAGDGSYNAAVSQTQTQKIKFVATKVGPISQLDNPVQVRAETKRNGIKSLNITVHDIPFTNRSGFSYGLFTGYRGTVARVTITAFDEDNNNMTDFSTDPIELKLNLPHANTANVLYLYKLDPVTFLRMDPQPDGFPKTLTYDAVNDHWTTNLLSLSDYAVTDTTPLVGVGGGDPHIVTIFGEKYLLPNWSEVNLLTSEKYKVNATCRFLRDEEINTLHKVEKETKEIKKLSRTKKSHRYARIFKYFDDVIITDQQGNKFIINCDTHEIKTNELTDINIEKVIPKEGLISYIHDMNYALTEDTKEIKIDLPELTLQIKTDNFWDEKHNLNLLLKENCGMISGAFIENNQKNKIS